MSEKNAQIEDGGRAGGMSLRDYFAAQAMAGIMASDAHCDSTNDSTEGCRGVAEHAVKVADALIAELRRLPQPEVRP